MKIGIITYHFANNYGAVLQCYALQKYFLQKGYEVEVFNFISKKQKENNGIIKRGKGIKGVAINLCLMPFWSVIAKKKKRYDTFLDTYLQLTKRFSVLEEMEEYINAGRFDILISGSDQVFNPNIPDFNLAFLYPFKTKARKVAYAASTGNASENDIASLENLLKDFYKISIREKKDISKFSVNMQQDLSVVCDPVMLLECDGWKDMTAESVEEPYLVCYFLHKNLFEAEFLIARKIADKLGLQLKVINARYGKWSLNKGTIFDAGAREFVNLIANASYVCTDSFHGTLFSLIFHKRFSCFDTKMNLKDTRKRGLLEETGTMQAFQNVEEEIKICPELDYSYIDTKIEAMRDHANDFLVDSL